MHIKRVSRIAFWSLLRSLAITTWGNARILRAFFALGVPPLFVPYRLLVLHKFGGKLRINLKFGSRTIHIRPKSSDLHVLAQTFPSYFPRTHYEIIKNHYSRILDIGKVPIVLDAGAYTGITSLLFCSTFPKSMVYAIEPSSENFRILQMNTRNETNIETINAALGPIGMPLYLVDPNMGEWGYRADPVELAEGATPIETIQPTEIVLRKENSEPFLCKLDIEGGERHLTESDWSRILEFPVIVIEPHDWMMPGKHTSFGFFQAHSTFKAKRDLVIVGENLWSIAVN